MKANDRSEKTENDPLRKEKSKRQQAIDFRKLKSIVSIKKKKADESK
jgi:hypothetical protein